VSRAQRPPRTVLEHLIQQRDRTYEELADEFSRYDVHAAISARHLGRLARGERSTAGTTPATRRALQAMFGLPADDLLRSWAPDPLPTEPVINGIEPLSVVSGSERSILTMAAERARRFTMFAAEGTTPDVIEQLYADVQRLATSYPQRPITELLGELAETQDALFTLIERRPMPNQARQLHFLAAVSSGLLAKASHDLAQPASAMTQARTAILCAKQADHNGLTAWLCGLQSLVAYWAGRYGEALRYADQGSAYADRTGGTTSVWLPLSAARAHAALGNGSEALAKIRHAEDAWNNVEPDEVDELGGICSFNHPRATYYAADALVSPAMVPYVSESDPDMPASYAVKAVEEFSDHNRPTWAFGDQAGAHTDLAIARVVSRELEGAREALLPVFELPPEKRINGVTQSVQRVQDSLIRVGLASDAPDLIDQIEDFTRLPLKALPH